jgi:antitoxin ParD1/3/4
LAVILIPGVIKYEQTGECAMTIRHTISLPDPMSQYIDLQITSGLYGNISEYIRDLIRKDQEQKQLAISELRNVLDRAEASGISRMSMRNPRLGTGKGRAMSDQLSKDAEQDKENVRRTNCVSHAVYYQVTERDVLVLRVLHQSRDPARHL